MTDLERLDRMRSRAVYSLIMLSFLVLIAGVFVIERVVSLERDLTRERGVTTNIVVAQRDACERGNLRRSQDKYTLSVIADLAEILGNSNLTTGPDTQRFLDTAADLRQRTRAETLQPVDCVTRYPLPGG